MHVIEKIWILIFLMTFPFYAKTNSLIDSTSSKKQDDFSHFHLQMTVGLCEYFSLGIGYNFDKNNSIMITSGGVIIGNGHLGGGYGIKYTYSYESDIIFKNISVLILPLKDITLDRNSYNKEIFIKGMACEITTERKKVYDKWIVFQYEVGLLMTKCLQEKINFWPIIKIGFNINM